MEILRYIAISFISGLTAIIPGVSGGTIFAIFGISEQMADDINGLTTGIFKNITSSFQGLVSTFKQHGKLPIIIGVGSLVSSLIYAKLIVSYGNSVEFFLRFLFIGLVVFSLPTLWAETFDHETNRKYRLKYVYVCLGFLFALALYNANDSVIKVGITDYNSVQYLIYFFVVSLVAGITAILPGISGTNILIIGGVFTDYVLFSSKLSEYPLQYVIYILATILGSVLAAKCFTFLFKYFRQSFFSIMTGLTASTIVFIIAMPTTLNQTIQGLIGFIIAYLLIKTLNQQQTNIDVL